MRNLMAIFACGTAIAMSAPALAQEGNDSTFTGPRVEALVGYEKTKAGSSMDDDVNQRNDQSIEGVVYGIGVGYDFDVGGMVIGAEAELTDSTAKTKFNDGDFEGFGLGSVKTGRDMYVGARVGVKVTPKVLVYAKGGYTNAKFDVLSRNGEVEFRRDLDVDGWRAGAGAELALNKHAYAKLEYRYSKYGKAEVDFSGDVPDSNRFNIDTDRHQLIAAVGWRF